MSIRSLTQTGVITALLGLLQVSTVQAQPLGTFRWQLQPFCNVLTLSVTQNGGIYRLEGVDELCGGTSPAAVVGIAHQKPDGTIGFGMTVLLQPGATSLHITATINLSSLSGTWEDDGGNSGALTFNPTVAAGIPRPVTDRSASGWVVLNSNASIRAASPNMQGVSVQKPPSSVGVYCFRFPAAGTFQRGGAVGSLIQPQSGNGEVGFMTVTSTINSICSNLGPWDVTVQTYNVSGILADRYFRLFVPR
jgi:hypothetical protein